MSNPTGETSTSTWATPRDQALALIETLRVAKAEILSLRTTGKGQWDGYDVIGVIDQRVEELKSHL